MKLDWKYKVWISVIVLAGIFTLFMFSIEAIQDMGNYFGDAMVNELTVFP